MAESLTTDCTLKIVIIGDPSVGKSNLLSRFTRNEFSLEFHSKFAMEFSTKEVQIDGKKINVQIWGAPGQERYRAISVAFYRDALGALLVFDIHRERTFQNLDQWYREIREFANTDCSIVLVGNKLDQQHIRTVSSEDAKRHAEEKNIQYIETSALDATNVEEAFHILIMDIYRNRTIRKDSLKKHT